MLHGLVALTTLYVMDCQGISQPCKTLSLNLKLYHGIFVDSISSPYDLIEHMNDGKAKFFLQCIASRNHPMCFSKCHLCVMQQVTTNILFDLQAPMPWSLELTRAMVKVLWQCSQLLLRADLALAGHVNAVSQVRCAH